MMLCLLSYLFFFFNDTATTEIYTLSLHDALPIYSTATVAVGFAPAAAACTSENTFLDSTPDRKSTRLNSSHSQISYAVFCLKKKKNTKRQNVSNTASRDTQTKITHNSATSHGTNP